MANVPMLIARPPTSFFLGGGGGDQESILILEPAAFSWLERLPVICRVGPRIIILSLWARFATHCRQLRVVLKRKNVKERERGSGRAWFKTNSKYTVKKGIHLHHLWKKQSCFNTLCAIRSDFSMGFSHILYQRSPLNVANLFQICFHATLAYFQKNKKELRCGYW
jgi:hypothetical protein